MSDFDNLAKEVQDGIHGKNAGVPMGFQRLNNHISIRKSNNYLLGGYTGSGKTALLDDAFVLNPIDYILNHPSEGVELEIIYWSMERRKGFKLAKWISRRIFLDKGIIIPVTRLMGWCPKEQRLTKYEHDLFLSYKPYIEAILSIVTIKDYPENPTGIRNYIRDRMMQNGKTEDIDEFHKIYLPDKPNKIILNIKDHVGLLKGEKDLRVKKEII